MLIRTALDGTHWSIDFFANYKNCPRDTTIWSAPRSQRRLMVTHINWVPRVVIGARSNTLRPNVSSRPLSHVGQTCISSTTSSCTSRNCAHNDLLLLARVISVCYIISLPASLFCMQQHFQQPLNRRFYHVNKVTMHTSLLARSGSPLDFSITHITGIYSH